jgi:LysM repeat protein
MFMHYKFQLLFFLGFLTTSQLFSASILDSLRVEQKDGKRMIVHQVDAGETLFALSRKYKVDVATIKSENALSSNSLNLGQLIYLPVTESVTTNVKDQNQHKVKAGETLYSIARQYQLSVSDLKSWNDLKSANLEIGQVINLGNTTIIEANKKPDTKINVQSEPDKNSEVNSDLANTTHKVQSGETLYSISRKYSISIQDLKALNVLNGNSVDIGQVLILKSGVLSNNKNDNETTIIEDDTYVSPVVEVLPAVEEKKLIKEPKMEEALPKPQRYGNSDKRVINENGFDQVIEEGFGMKIENSPDTQKYLALHRTLPIGKIIQIKNQMNNQTIFVRVIGKLPDVGANTNVLVRLSEQAFSRLGAIDPKIPIEITYLP